MKKHILTIITPILFGFFTLNDALACRNFIKPIASKGLTIVNTATAKIRPTSGSGYMVLKNQGKNSIILRKYSSDISEITELHEVIHENDVMKMRKQEYQEIKAGETFELKSMSWHFMFLKLKENEVKKALETGSFKIKIEYKNESIHTCESFKTTTIEVPVQIIK